MNSTVFAPRPRSTNWGRVIYNVMQDSGKRHLTQEEIWQLVPASMHVSHAKTKFRKALANMVYRGYVIASPPGKTSKSVTKHYRLATKAEFDVRTRVIKRKNTLRKKKKAETVAAKKQSTRGANTGPFDATIKSIDSDIATLKERLNKLQVARDALAGIS